MIHSFPLSSEEHKEDLQASSVINLWHTITNGDFSLVLKNATTQALEVVLFENQDDALKKKLAKNNEAKMGTLTEMEIKGTSRSSLEEKLDSLDNHVTRRSNSRKGRCSWHRNVPGGPLWQAVRMSTASWPETHRRIMGIFVDCGPIKSGVKNLFGGVVGTVMSPGGSPYGQAVEGCDIFLARNTSPDHLICTGFE
ncbi:hypothetical protein Tco_0364781 [Tanacetum coccineum]